MQIIMQTLLFVLHVQIVIASVYGQDTYKAAVIEYTPKPSDEAPEKRMLENVNEFVNYIKEAAKKQVDIILFPEYGLTGMNPSTTDLDEMSMVVPNPSLLTSPCKNPQNYSEVLTALSCAAETYSIYVVVNLFERVLQSSKKVYHNTNIAFNRKGILISRFRKMNLYNETYVETGNETAKFKTDFGVTFGMLICRDILFYNSSINLLLDDGVTDVLYSAAWSSELPFFGHLTVQHGYALANDVNLLASSYSNPPSGLGGSGIYFANGSVAETYISGAKSSRMLVANVPKTYKRKPIETCQNVVLSGVDSSEIGTEFKTAKEDLSNYTFVALNLNQTEIYESACSDKETCCHINITLSRSKSKTNYLYMLVVYNGGRYILTESIGVRVCALVACLNDSINSCGLRSNSPPSDILFESIWLKGTFKNEKSAQDRPATLVYGLRPLSKYTYCKIITNKTVENTMATMSQTNLLTFGVQGRVFENDNKGGGIIP